MIKESLWKENTKKLDQFSNRNVEELVHFAEPHKNNTCVVHENYADIAISNTNILKNVKVRDTSMPANIVWCKTERITETANKPTNIEVYYFLSEKLINRISNISNTIIKELGITLYRTYTSKDMIIREKHLDNERSYSDLPIGKSIDILLKYLATNENTEVIQKMPLNLEKGSDKTADKYFNKMIKVKENTMANVNNELKNMAKRINNTLETKVEDGFTKEGRWFRRSRFVLGVSSGIGLYHLMTHLDDRGVQTISKMLGLSATGLVGIITTYSSVQTIYYSAKIVGTLLTGKGISNYNKNSIKFLKYSGMLGGSLITLEYIQPGIIQKVIAMVV